MAAYVRLGDELPPPKTKDSVVVVGNFDGVHRGHAAVLATAAARARAGNLGVSVLTFDPHPRSILPGHPSPTTLTGLEERAVLLRRAGAGEVFVRTFDEAFAAWSPRRFVEALLVSDLSAKIVMIGENFHFGSMAKGDFVTMAAFGREMGFETVAHPLAGDERGPFSSSRVRNAIEAGNMEEAEHVLGRPHALSGVVAHGKKLGRTLGFPTANLSDVREMLPPDGIYACWVTRIDRTATSRVERYLGLGALSIGVRPTVGDALARTVEVYVLDLPEEDSNLYGAELRLYVAARLRGEERFADLKELTDQIGRDVEETRRRIGGKRHPAESSFE